MLMLGCAFWLGARDVRGAEDVPLRPCLCFMLWLTWVKGVSSDVDEIASSGPYMLLVVCGVCTRGISRYPAFLVLVRRVSTDFFLSGWFH